MSIMSRLSSLLSLVPRGRVAAPGGMVMDMAHDGRGLAASARDSGEGAPARGSLDHMRRSADELLRLVQKVDTHMDRHNRRSARLSEIAERVPLAIDTLPEIRDQQERMVDALEDLSSCAREGGEYARFTMAQMHTIADRLDRSLAAQTRLVETLDSLERTLAHAAETCARATRACGEGRVRERRRDRRAALMLTRQCRMTKACMAACVLCGVAAVAAAVVAVVVG